MPSAPSSPPSRREIAGLTGADTLVELGSGTSEKTRLLLDALADGPARLDRFVPFDVSEAVLRPRLPTMAADRWPGVHVHAVVGDFHRHLGEVPTDGAACWPSSAATIGNLDPRPAHGVPRRHRRHARRRRLVPRSAPTW